MNLDHAFDPRLPELPLALDQSAVGKLFAERWPAEDRPAGIRSCRLQDVKYEPGVRCVTTWELRVEREAAEERSIGVVELTPAGLTHRLFSDDPGLPWLAEASNPRRMAPRFAALLGAPVAECAVTPVRYRAGARCMFRYDVRTAAGQTVVFGKLLEPGSAALAATVATLHRASMEDPELPYVPPALAYWPEVRMVLQPEVAGRAELNDLAFSQEVDPMTRERWLRQAGLGLARLHALGRGEAPASTLQADLAELGAYVAPMAAADAQLADRYRAAIEQLAWRARGLAEPDHVASHGAFRTDQLMIMDGRLALIDLDGFCRANPARDRGNFLAYLRWKAIRQPQRAALIAEAAQLFAEGYWGGWPPADDSWQAIYQALSMLKIAGRRYRSLTAREWPLVPALLDAALDIRSSAA